MDITYTQDIKNKARRIMLQHAVKSLTIDRNSASCVDNYYVRNIYNYFLSLAEGHDYDETIKIDLDYIVEWERHWAVQIGSKKPEDLTVCYLSGPEPQNDFNELISLGILPQNIWAFEMNRGIYAQALDSYDNSNFKQPKIIKMSIEKFFESIPKKFDIVYIDACGSLISDKHALRCISTLFKYHRLNSPGMLLTNFAEIEAGNHTERSIYVDIMSKYFLLKQNSNAKLIDDEKAFFKEINQSKINELDDNFDYYYGELITSLICDIASVTVPNLRFANSRYWSDFIDVIPPMCDYIGIKDVNAIKNNSVYKFFLCNKLFDEFNSTDRGISKINKLASEMTGITPQNIDLLSSMRIIQNIKKDKILDFPIDIVEINQANNENFSPIDLFLRLNTKPYPILPNTFEMWNAYIDMQVVYKIKDISKEYANKLFKQSDQRMKNEELITTLAYADYRFLKDKVKASETINIFIRNKRINARMNKKSNITTLFDNITKNNDTSFLDSVNNVSVFIDKLKALTGDNFEEFNILISHKRANVQSRTNQNFYLLWVALCNIPLDKIKVHKEEVFNKIANQFEIAQNVPDNLNVLDFIRDLENII